MPSSTYICLNLNYMNDYKAVRSTIKKACCYKPRCRIPFTRKNITRDKGSLLTLSFVGGCSRVVAVDTGAYT